MRQQSGGFDTREGIENSKPSFAHNAFSKRLSRLIYSNKYSHRTCVFSKEGKSAKTRAQTTAYTRLCPHRLTPHLQILAGAHNFPPHLSGVPPDPVPPLRLRMQRLGVHSSKLGGAGGSPRSFGHRPKPRSPSATWSRPLRSSPVAAVLGWAHGVGRQSRRRRIVARWGALLALGCRQMRGVSAGAQHMKPHRVANAPRYSHGRVLIFCAT